MKRYKILSAAMVAAVLGGASAMAQFNYQNGDMLAAFGNGGSTDVIVDLGSIANFQVAGAAPVSFTGISAALNATFGSVNSSIYWGIFGVNDLTETPSNPSVTQADPNTIWATQASTTATPHVSGSSLSQGLAVGNIETIGNLTIPSEAAPGAIVDYAPGIELVSTSSSLGGFSSQNDPTHTQYNGNFQGSFGWNILNNGASTSVLYQSDPGTRTQLATPLGGFTLGSDGSLTYDAIPEPSTWAMLGSGALALLALRRRR